MRRATSPPSGCGSPMRRINSQAFRIPMAPGITSHSACSPGRSRGGRTGCRHALRWAIKPGKVDRSPTGTAVSARLAVLHARGLIREGETFTATSIIGSVFTGRIVGTAQVGDILAVISQNCGSRVDHRHPSTHARPRRPVARGVSRQRRLGRRRRRILRLTICSHLGLGCRNLHCGRSAGVSTSSATSPGGSRPQVVAQQMPKRGPD